MNSDKKLSIMQNMIWNTIGSFTYLICQWLLTLILVRVSGDMDSAGNLALAISITNVFYNLAHFNVRTYLVSDLQERYSLGEYSALRIVTSAFALISCIVYSCFFDYSPEQFWCIVLYMIFKLGEVWVDLLHGVEQRASRMDIGGISLFARGIISIVSFGGVLFLTDDFNLSIIAMTLCTWLFIFVYDNPSAWKFGRFVPKFRPDTLKSMVLVFLPLTIGSFASNIGLTIPKQILEFQMGSEALGIYSTVATPTVIVQVAASYVFNPVLTRFAEAYNKTDKKDFKQLFLKISGVLVALSILCIIGAAVLGEWGLGFLYGDRIKSYTYLFLPAIYFTCMNSFVWFTWYLLIVMRKLNSLLVVNVIGLILGLPIMKVLIEAFGMNGVNYALCAYSVLLILLQGGLIVIDLNRKERILVE